MSLILNDEITSIREEIDDEEKESGGEIRGVKKRKIKIEGEWERTLS